MQDQRANSLAVRAGRKLQAAMIKFELIFGSVKPRMRLAQNIIPPGKKAEIIPATGRAALAAPKNGREKRRGLRREQRRGPIKKLRRGLRGLPSRIIGVLKKKFVDG